MLPSPLFTRLTLMVETGAHPPLSDESEIHMNRKPSGLFAVIAISLFFLTTAPLFAQVSLGTAQNFGALGGSTVTNTGATTVNGNVGVSPGSAVTGFPPGVVVGGSIHSNDAVAVQAQSDLTTAYNNIAGTPCNVDLTGQNLGGLVLTPGVYCFSTSAQLTGSLALDALGNPNALFLFKIGSTLTTASGSTVTVINNGGSSCNKAYWQVGSSATLGTGTSFAGDILALTSITLTTGASTSGRTLARNGAVTLDTNNVNTCGILVCPVITVNPATLPNGTVNSAYNQIVTASGGTSPYTFSVSSGSLPTGLLLNSATGAITGTPTAAGSFTFSITARDATGCTGSRVYTITIAAPGCNALVLSPSTLPPGTVGSIYNQTITASGGGSFGGAVAPARRPIQTTGAAVTIVFVVSSGALPPGLTLSPNGLLAGTPTTPGLFSFTIRATDSFGCTGSRPYTIAVAAAAVVGTPPAGGATLDTVGLAILMVLLIAAGWFAMNRLSI